MKSSFLVVLALAASGCTGQTVAALSDRGPDAEAEASADATPWDALSDGASVHDASADADAWTERDAANLDAGAPGDSDGETSPDGDMCGMSGACTPGTSKACNTYGTTTCSALCVWNACSCPSAPSCTPGALGCASAQPQQCNQCGQWQNQGTQCMYVCTAGACAGSCAPGAAECSSANDLETCGANGQWGQPQVCANGCMSGMCVP